MYTGTGYGGERACYGSLFEFNSAIASQYPNPASEIGLRYPTILHDNAYSSYRDALSICYERGISPCRLNGSSFVINNIVGSFYKDPYLDDTRAYLFDGHADFDFGDTHWFDLPWYGDIDDKISSLDFSVSVSQ